MVLLVRKIVYKRTILLMTADINVKQIIYLIYDRLSLRYLYTHVAVTLSASAISATTPRFTAIG
jgi:hypothetical protein